MPVDLETILILVPEGALILSATALFVLGAADRRRSWWPVCAALPLLFALVMVVRDWGRPVVYSGPLIQDATGDTGRLLSVVLGLVMVLMAWRQTHRKLATEFFGGLLMVVAGLMLVSRANDLVFLFLGTELVSIPTYMLLFLGKRNRASSEATVKYFFLSLLASALFLYGVSFVYGMSGTTLLVGSGDLLGIRDKLPEIMQSQIGSLLPLGLVLVLAGLGFKITAVPFHFYAPDVYQGTTNVNAAFLACAPKIAGILALTRIVVNVVPAEFYLGAKLVIVLAIVTMTVGNVCALWQTHVRRLMAYSSIAHAGYLLIGLALGLAAASSGGLHGLSAMLFYLVLYVVATLGTFGAFAYVRSHGEEAEHLDDLAGLSQTRAPIAAMLAVCMLSLAGIPPLAGFWGKLTLFSGAVELAFDMTHPMRGWFAVLAVAGALNAAIAAAYYLRVILVMYFKPPHSDRQTAADHSLQTVVAICSVLLVLICADPGRLLDAIEPQAVRARQVPVEPELGMNASDDEQIPE